MERVNREKEHFETLYQCQKTKEYLLRLQSKEADNYLYKTNLIKEAIPNLCNLKVLEIGCGQGNLTQYIHTYIHTAIDISFGSLTHIRKFFSDIRLVAMALEQMGFKYETFDVVIGSGILHHVDIELALCEIERVLKPDGYFVFFEPNLYFIENYLLNKSSFFRKRSTLSQDERHFSKKCIYSKFQKYKFKGIKADILFTYHPKITNILKPLNVRINRFFKMIDFQWGARELVITGQRI